MKNFVKNTCLYIVDYIKTTDIFLIFMSVGASVLSFALMFSLYPAQISNIRTVYVQIISSIIGIVCAIFMSNIDYHQITKMWKPIGISAAIFTLLTLTPLGTLRGGDGAGSADRSWVQLGFTNVQPSEFLKAAFIVTLSYHCFKVSDKINEPKVFMRLLGHALIPIAIIFLQKDFGTMIIFICIAACILFVAGINWKIISAVVAMGVVALILFLTNTLPDYLLKRLYVINHLEETKRGLGMQQYNGRITLASGKILGKGFNSDDILTKTPELYNDMIFAHIGQVLGFVGCVSVLLWLFLYCFRLLQNGKNAPDKLGYFICVGIFAIMFFQSMVNIGMVLCLTPVIGVTLPFISSGGSSVVATYILLGLALSVHNHTHKSTLF